MANDVIARARRAAKAMSRSKDMGYQQALDAVAREAGFGTWSAMLASEGGNVPPDAPRHAEPAVSDWRLRALERLEGSRHSPADESGISMVGRGVARLSDLSGLPVLAIAAAIPTMGGLFVASLVDLPVRAVFVDIIVTTAFVVLYGMATLRSPDHHGARRARRVGRILVAGMPLLIASFCLPAMYRYGTVSTDGLWQHPITFGLDGCWFTIAMWGCAWEGRRRRRNGAGASSRDIVIPPPCIHV